MLLSKTNLIRPHKVKGLAQGPRGLQDIGQQFCLFPPADREAYRSLDSSCACSLPQTGRPTGHWTAAVPVPSHRQGGLQGHWTAVASHTGMLGWGWSAVSSGVAQWRHYVCYKVTAGCVCRERPPGTLPSCTHCLPSLSISQFSPLLYHPPPPHTHTPPPSTCFIVPVPGNFILCDHIFFILLGLQN